MIIDGVYLARAARSLHGRWTMAGGFDTLTTMEINRAVTALAALAQQSRLEVFRLLVRHAPQGLPAGEIAQQLNVPPATLSFHLKELSHAGLIGSQRRGRSIIYAVDVAGISALMAFLTEDCCQGRPELCMPGVCCAEKPSSGKRRSKGVRA
jgi:DNA-binding transcriptional ArsR family regulator